MILLDEDIPEDQHQLLRSWRLRVRRIGAEVGRLGMKDRDILALLHSLSRPTLFTLDHGFFKRRFCHPGYCLVYLDVQEKEAAGCIGKQRCRIICERAYGAEYPNRLTPGFRTTRWE